MVSSFSTPVYNNVNLLTNTFKGLVNITASSSLNEIASNFSVALGNAKPVALQSDSYTPTDNQVKACPTIDPVWGMKTFGATSTCDLADFVSKLPNTAVGDC